MFKKIKKNLYFLVAYYFKFFAFIQLKIWQPKIIVVTGSNGKTSTLHLLESQLQDQARYSHFANSAFGIPFDILGINRTKFSKAEWLKLFFIAPIKAFKKPFEQSIYVAEADCDRPHEGRFLSKLLKPSITIWLSSARTHSYNFDNLVKTGKFKTVEDAIAYEYGHHIENTKDLVIINHDNKLINKQLKRTRAQVINITKQNLQDYQVSLQGTSFKINNKIHELPFLLPAEIFYSISATLEATNYLKLKVDDNFSKLIMPPGRSSVFKGIKQTTIIDSSYNANYESVSAILNLVKNIKNNNQWLILGDLLELGEKESEEYNKIADLLIKSNFEKIILVGPKLNQIILEKLKTNKHRGCQVIGFLNNIEAQDFIMNNLARKELLIFKASGGQSIEKIIANILLDKKDIAKLCRQ